MLRDGMLYHVQQLHKYNDLKASNEEFTIHYAKETIFFGSDAAISYFKLIRMYLATHGVRLEPPKNPAVIFSKNILTSETAFGPLPRFGRLVGLNQPVKLAGKAKKANWNHIGQIVKDTGHSWTTKSSRNENLRCIVYCSTKNNGDDLVELWSMLDYKYGKCNATDGKRQENQYDNNNQRKPRYTD